jgi:hypothetical protein
LSSIFVALIFKVQEREYYSCANNGAECERHGKSEPTEGYLPEDASNLMQDSRVHVEFLADNNLDPSPASSKNSTGNFAKRIVFSLVSRSQVVSKVQCAAGTLQKIAREYIQEFTSLASMSHLTGTTQNGATALLFVVFFIVAALTCIMLFMLRKQEQKTPSDSGRTAGRWAPNTTERPVQAQQDRQPVTLTASTLTYQRSAATPNFPTISAEGTWASLPRAGSALTAFGAYPRSVATDRDLPRDLMGSVGASSSAHLPPGSSTSVIGERSNFAPILFPTSPVLESKSTPPPLCPTLVLPICEARFGVPMHELAQLTSEGEIGIVGMSGNALLRASLKKVGNQRLLEMCMPEANSAPRATIGPAGPGTKSLEIRALKGALYGTLEMRSSGACFVVKDGVTILSIDGDTDSLQLQIRSGHGVELASVSCSTEALGGVDHVEVRVEPGVDTVLVLSCVLAVLLLSPYPPE